MTAALLRYFPRQLYDTLLTRGAAMVVIGVMLSLPLLLGAVPIAEDTDVAARLQGTLQGAAAFLVMVATYGIIQEDVRRGYFRFLFAKPIQPIQYYLQAFVAALLAFLLAQLVMIGIFAVMVQPAWPRYWLLDSSAFFVLFGSLVFALSRATRLDWLLGLALLVVGQGVRDWYPAAESLRGKIFNVIFPPAHVFDQLFSDGGFAWGYLAWVGGYSAVCLAVGLTLVRFVPFGTQH